MPYPVKRSVATIRPRERWRLPELSSILERLGLIIAKPYTSYIFWHIATRGTSPTPLVLSGYAVDGPFVAE